MPTPQSPLDSADDPLHAVAAALHARAGSVFDKTAGTTLERILASIETLAAAAAVRQSGALHEEPLLRVLTELREASNAVGKGLQALQSADSVAADRTVRILDVGHLPHRRGLQGAAESFQDAFGREISESGCYAEGRIWEAAYAAGHDAATIAGAAPLLAASDGDLLPPLGSLVDIHLASVDAWVPHHVIGYVAWPDHAGGDPSLVRLFVRVRAKGGTENQRLLSDVRPHGAASPKTKPFAARPHVAKVVSLDVQAGTATVKIQEVPDRVAGGLLIGTWLYRRPEHAEADAQQHRVDTHHA